MSQVAQSISYQSASRQIDGYLARPEGDGPFPGIVVIHEAFGLNENIKDITRRLADAGKIVLFISHRLGEVKQVADRFTVFRNGRNVGSRLPQEATSDELVALMLGLCRHRAQTGRIPQIAENKR